MFDAEVREDLYIRFSGLDQRIFDREDPDRMASAIILKCLQGHSVSVIFEEAQTDYRDLLMESGVEDLDWRDVVAERFGSAPPGRMG